MNGWINFSASIPCKISARIPYLTHLLKTICSMISEFGLCLQLLCEQLIVSFQSLELKLS